jgi:hypothetical protein
MANDFDGGTGISCITCSNMICILSLCREEILDISAIFIASAKAISDGFELS